MTRVWLVRLGKYGEAEPLALESGELATGWTLPEFDKPMSKTEILGLLQSAEPDEKPGTLANWAVQLNQLCNKAKEGDLTVTPLKTASRQLAIGRILGGHFLSKGKHPARRVEWLQTDIPRDSVKQDLLHSLGASQTICEISRNNAAYRFEAIAKTRRDPGNSSVQANSKPLNTSDPEDDNDIDERIDIYETARDQIERHISTNFVGHAFTHLIDAILKADGYQTRVSPPGSDKGVDILAGQGVLGFDAPKLIVQVKSGDMVVDQPTLQSLLGCIQDVQADHGLLVSWSGFKSSVHKRGNDLYFRVRLWGRDEIMEALFRTYERLPEQIKADLPLQKIWAYLPDDD